MVLKQHRRRKKYLVHHRLQIRYLTLIALGMLVPLLITVGTLYYLFWQAAASELAIPEAIVLYLHPAIQHAQVSILIVLPIACLLVFWAALMVTNRIAGPLVRLENELQGMVDGKQSHHRIQVRKRDELKELVFLVNQALDRERRH
jgi:hypothetical protein